MRAHKLWVPEVPESVHGAKVQLVDSTVPLL